MSQPARSEHSQQFLGEPSVVRIFVACLAVVLVVGLYVLVTGLDALIGLQRRPSLIFCQLDWAVGQFRAVKFVIIGFRDVPRS